MPGEGPWAGRVSGGPQPGGAQKQGGGDLPAEASWPPPRLATCSGRQGRLGHPSRRHHGDLEGLRGLSPGSQHRGAPAVLLRMAPWPHPLGGRGIPFAPGGECDLCRAGVDLEHLGEAGTGRSRLWINHRNEKSIPDLLRPHYSCWTKEERLPGPPGALMASGWIVPPPHQDRAGGLRVHLREACMSGRRDL